MCAGKRLLFAAAVSLCLAAPAAVRADRQWEWEYAGEQVMARGTLTTTDDPNTEGFFQVIGIAGTRNGVAVIGLQKTGTAIPGNEPYAVDNLIRAMPPHLTEHGIGYALSDGTFTNPFFNDTATEFFSSLVSINSAHKENKEWPIRFSATVR